MKRILLLTIFFIISGTFLLGDGDSNTERENVYLKVLAVNPSTEKSQTVEVKNYLPPEVAPENVISTGGLKLKYDSKEKAYYVYKEVVNLEPGEICIFIVELKDVWFIPQEELDALKDQTKNILVKVSKENKNYDSVKSIADNIYKEIDDIATSQEKVKELGFKRQLINYRDNQQILEEIKEDINLIKTLLATDKEIKKEEKKERRPWWRRIVD